MAAKDDWEELPLESSTKAPASQDDDWEEVPQVEEKSFGQSLSETGTGLLRGAEQGATLGFADELGSWLENYKMKQELERMGLSQDTLNQKALEEQAKQEKANLEATRQEYRAAQEAAPIAFGAGQIGGGIATGMATGGLGAGTGLVKQGVISGIEGGLTGYGASEAETLGEALPEIATGAALGAVAPAAGKYVLAPAGKLAMAPVKAAGKAVKNIASDIGQAEIFKDIKKGFEFGAKKGHSLFSEAPALEASQQLEESLGQGVGVVSAAKKQSMDIAAQAEKEVLENTKAAQEKIEQQLTDVDALETANKKLLKEQQQAFEVGKASKVSKLNKQADVNAKKLADKYNTLYSSLGSSRKQIVQTLDQQGVKVDTLPFEEEISRLFGKVTTDENTGNTVFSNMRNINAADTTKLSSILDDIRKFQGEIPYSKVEELRDILQKYAYGRGGVTDESKIALKSLYAAMNDSIDNSLKQQGFGETAARLGEINQGFRTLYRGQGVGLEKLGAEDLISGTGYQKFARQAGDEGYTPQFGEQKERISANIEEILQSPAIPEAQKQELRQALEQAKTTSKQLVGTEAEKFAGQLPEVPRPVTTVDQEAIRAQTMANPEYAQAAKNMEQVKDVEQTFGDVLTKGTKEPRLASKVLATAEQAGTDKFAGKIRDIDSLKKAIKVLDPENADKIIAGIDKSVEEAGFISRVNRGAPIGDISSQATGGPRALAVKGASALGVAKKQLKDEISKATPESLRSAAKMIRDNVAKPVAGAVKQAGKVTSDAFAEMLEKASANPDKIARQATIYQLLQNPTYRELTEENENK
jgi:hypothetical protein